MGGDGGRQPAGTVLAVSDTDAAAAAVSIASEATDLSAMMDDNLTEASTQQRTPEPPGQKSKKQACRLI
jgi:hypothetical protein